MNNKIAATLTLASVIGLSFSGVAGAEDFIVEQKFAHTDDPAYITESSVVATIGAGDEIVIATSDAYAGRSNSSQKAERVNIYGVNDAGERTLIGTTDDLDDGMESTNRTSTLTSNGDYTSVFIELDKDMSSPNSVFVNGFTVNRAPVAPVPEPELPAAPIIDEPFVPEMIETTPDAPIDPETPVEPSSPPVTYDKPTGTLPLTGTSESLAMGAGGLALVLGGLGLVGLAED